MSRHASLVVAIVVVWSIALGGALFVASLPYARAHWLAVNGFMVAISAGLFVVVFVPLSIWAARTSVALIREHRVERGALRRAWPSTACRAELQARGLLDRRGQPGPCTTVSGDIVGALRGGERSQCTIVVTEPTELWIAVDGPDATARALDVELRELAVARDGTPRQLFADAGTYRVVIERDGTHAAPEDVWALWIGTAPSEA